MTETIKTSGKKGVRAVVLENGRQPVDVSKPNNYPMTAISSSIPIFLNS